MAIKRVVDTKFWTDSTVIDRYTVEDKYFQLYLMTNPRTTQLGIYPLPKKIIAFETGYSVETITYLLERFQDSYKNIVYSDESQEIAVLNSLKYSIVKGGFPVQEQLKKELDTVEDARLIEAVYSNMVEWWMISKREFDKTIKELFENEMRIRSNANANANANAESIGDSVPDSVPDSKTPAKTANRFKKPSLEELKAYCNEKSYTFDPESFLAFYESKGWRVGNAPMKSWQAACITWQKREKPKPKAGEAIDFAAYR